MTRILDKADLASLKRRSWQVTDGPQRAPHRAMFHAMGLTGDDLQRPMVGIANTFNDVTPCNLSLQRLTRKAKEGVRMGGGTPFEFGAIAVSDAIAMGHQGMKASLISREIIADSIELMTRAECFDGIITLAGCDKSLPGSMMAMARLNVPSIFIYGGTILPGDFHLRPVTIQDVFEAVGAHSTGRMNDDDLKLIESRACPGEGSCGGLFTANTMSSRGRGNGHLPAWNRLHPRGRLPEGRHRHTVRRRVDQPHAGADPPQRHHDPQSLRERHNRCDGYGRLHQRRVAPSSHRLRSRRGALH